MRTCCNGFSRVWMNVPMKCRGPDFAGSGAHGRTGFHRRQTILRRLHRYLKNGRESRACHHGMGASPVLQKTKSRLTLELRWMPP